MQTAQLAEAQLRLARTEQGMADDRVLITLLEEQLENYWQASLNVRRHLHREMRFLQMPWMPHGLRKSVPVKRWHSDVHWLGKTYQQELGTAAISRITLQINALKQDIADTKITAPSDGQIIFIQPSQVGFNRTGDVLMRTEGAVDDFEIEVDIPLEYLGFVAGQNP